MALSAIHTLLALLNSSFKLSSKLTANNNKRGGRTTKVFETFAAYFVICCQLQLHTDTHTQRHTQPHTQAHTPLPLYNFISVLAAVFIPCSSSAGLISAAGRLPPPSSSLTVCVTCAAIWPRIMSSVRYLEPVCICISSCGCWHPLQKKRRRKKTVADLIGRA